MMILYGIKVQCIVTENKVFKDVFINEKILTKRDDGGDDCKECYR